MIRKTSTIEEYQSLHARPDLGTPYAAPMNDVEKKLAEIWQEVLRIMAIGVNDNFFELGGNSLIGMLLLQRIRKEYRVDLAMEYLFQNPTITEMASLILSINLTINIGSSDGGEEIEL